MYNVRCFQVFGGKLGALGLDVDPFHDQMSGATSPSAIQCLFSHKCSFENHAFGLRLKDSLASTGVDLLIDPFRPGDDVDTRMDSFEFDAVSFLWSMESEASARCQRELQTARRRAAPVFVAAVAELPPRSFRKRILWLPPPMDSPQFPDSVVNLGTAIRARVGLLRELRMLRDDNPPDETRDAAERIALDFDRTLLAESVPVLAKSYLRVDDPNTRFWIALALGSAGTAKASRLLNRLPEEDHPLVLEGIRQARELISRGT